MKAIPTKYDNRQYRSRLEAKWAAFFDKIGWDIEYEPFDLEGWTPDFLVKGKNKILVEVKPVEFDLTFNQIVDREIKEYLKPFEKVFNYIKNIQ